MPVSRATYDILLFFDLEVASAYLHAFPIRRHLLQMLFRITSGVHFVLASVQFTQALSVLKPRVRLTMGQDRQCTIARNITHLATVFGPGSILQSRPIRFLDFVFR
jgi:hypothetical protein